jgi:hypothetical protein
LKIKNAPNTSKNQANNTITVQKLKMNDQNPRLRTSVHECASQQSIRGQVLDLVNPGLGFILILLRRFDPGLRAPGPMSFEVQLNTATVTPPGNPAPLPALPGFFVFSVRTR